MGRYCYYLAQELRKMKVDMDVFTTQLHIKNLGEPLFFLRNSLLNLRKYDIVHSSRDAAVFVQHPLIVETYHHDARAQLKYSAFYALENHQCKRARHIIVPSHNSKNVLLRFGHPASKISVIYHGVDHNRFKPNMKLRKAMRKKYGIEQYFTVISVGRLVGYKRHVDIIEALNRMPDSVFILVGEGEEERKIWELASRKKVKLLHFTGITDKQLLGLYNASDVYVHTSIVEGFGLSVLEAMACGLPVIAYNTADFEHVVKDGGYLFRNGDITSIKRALGFLRENESETKRLGRKAAERSNMFSWEKSARAHYKTYKKILSND